MTRSVLISIGNRDNNLTQVEWVDYIREIREVLRGYQNDGNLSVHGEWFNAPDARLQTVSWWIEVDHPAVREFLRRDMTKIRDKRSRQWIAWSEGQVHYI